MRNRMLSLAALFALALAQPLRADDGTATLHYNDLENIQQQMQAIKHLDLLRAALFVVSNNPNVAPQSITLTLHLASGQTQVIPIDANGQVKLPESDALKRENPLISTNQPKHSMNASIVVDLAPLKSNSLKFAELMRRVQQINQAIGLNPTMAALFPGKSDGLLIFFNDGGHSLTLHGVGGDQVIKSLPPGQLAEHLKGLQTAALPAGATIIYVPLDAKLLKQNPDAALDRRPDDMFPAF